MLNNDAIPTLFAHNSDKQPQKRKASVLREEVGAKRQFCEDAFTENELIERFQFEYNTKKTQTETVNITTSSTSTQTEPNMTDVSMQREIEDAC